MRFGLDLSPSRFEPARCDLLAEARWAEAAGFDAVSLADHLVPYPAAAPPGQSVPDVWVGLTAAAAVTRRVTLVPLVCNAALNHPVRLAKMAATLDRLSGSRVQFGIGAGGYRVEEAACGQVLGWRERLTRLDESVAIVRRLWSGEPVDFNGQHFRFSGLISQPAPARRVPVLIGGQSAGVIEVATRHGDAINFAFAHRARAARLIGAVRDRCAALGRDPTTLEVSLFERVFLAETAAGAQAKWRRLGKPAVRGHAGLIGAPDEVAERIERLAEIGVAALFVTFADPESRIAFAEAILPRHPARVSAAGAGDA